jgi:hypothetical protein
MTPERKIKIASVLLRIVGVLALLPLLLVMYVIAMFSLDPSSWADMNLPGALLELLAYLSVCAIPFYVAHALKKRMPWSRWAGIVVGLLIVAYGLYSVVQGYQTALPLNIQTGIVAAIVGLCITILLATSDVLHTVTTTPPSNTPLI